MLRNTESSYGSVNKWLHWVMAIWFLLAYLVIYYLAWGHGDGPVPGLNYHKAVGFAILIPLVFRIYWRLTNPEPKLPAGMPDWQVRLSRLSHFLLYFFMISMPLSGYFGNGGGVDYGFIQIPGFSRTGLALWLVEVTGIPWPAWNTFFDGFHYGIVGPYVFWVLVAVHASAAVYHHVVQKDDVLTRMLPDTGLLPRRPGASSPAARTRCDTGGQSS